MKFKNLLVVLAATMMLSACADWIFRIDIPQGNFLDEKDVKKLRIEMTKEQVVFVLGKPEQIREINKIFGIKNA